MTHPEYALIVAGGKGTRFGSSLPKQFLELKDKPVLLHALEAFYRYSEKIQVILVLPEDNIEMWEQIARKHGFSRPLMLRAGGATRFQSVRNGLEMIPGGGYVAVHDGVRPLVTTDMIATSFRLAKERGSAVAAVPLKESLRMIQGDAASPTTQAVDRSRYRLIQTPQTFDVMKLKKAYDSEEDAALTDDASVMERAGFSIVLFDGSYRNIKITNREDLRIAEVLMAETPGL